MHRATQLGKKVLPLWARSDGCIPLTAIAGFSSSTRLAAAQPNPRIDLDPSLQTLLQDVDLALHNHSRKEKKRLHQLEVISTEEVAEDRSFENDAYDTEKGVHRKSPAASFGSQRIGAVTLPLELQHTIQRLISDTNKAQLHSDAQRLFQKEMSNADEWDLRYDGKYRTRIQGVKHAKRDGTAFASIALPAHYSAIYAVLDHVKRRLGTTWRAKRVLDWGAGVGSGLWASLHAFQGPGALNQSMADLRVADTTLESYVCIEKRNGLAEIGRRLVQDIQPEVVSVNWQKGWRPEDGVESSYGGALVGLSAFLLTTLPDALARKNLVQEIWNSGANTIILIDHNSKEGFEAIAGAREFLLSLGQKDLALGETSAVSGCHVVAPCPHDGICPLYYPGSTKLVCGYSQRIQRPEFVRRTKHSNVGHEDIGYSYVVVQRGSRPHPTTVGLGRIGVVGQRALEREASKIPTRELQVHDETIPEVSHPRDLEKDTTITSIQLEEGCTEKEIAEAIRLEAYQWPRLVFPPLKRNGHIIIDGCTAEGKIMRMTIPRSQGKQPFYDARKSNWGDIFPHPPKNKPQERQHVLKPGPHNVPGSDIGKRRSSRTKEAPTYEKIAKVVQDGRKESQRDERKARQSIWED
ncbi:hypothetical protein D9756_005834 [Leucocoprinus leucothites]|uniref:Rsm22-domain-containing protein n=1 Tax=Leucocoprinus leucothites TaxID=201217 RepID=A0A8H5D5L1_9AGAR|nr:hypothetical protein D9756_005834 [Leucoagaricus leucothites]